MSLPIESVRSPAVHLPPLPVVAARLNAPRRGTSAHGVPALIPEPVPPSADFSLSNLRNSDTVGALDDSPAPIGDLWQEQLCLERLHALLTHEVRWLRRSGARELEVTLKPDPATRIALQVRWTAGHYEAQARCHEGDFHLLNARWQDLRSLISNQGLVLGPLLPPPARVEFTPDARGAGARALPAPTFTS